MEKGQKAFGSGPADAGHQDPCPHPEVLAAWMDQGLDAAERTQVEAHLAGCDECRSVVVHVVEIQHALGEMPAAQPEPVSRTATGGRGLRQAGHADTRHFRTTVRWGAVALATAAALWLAVQFAPPTWWPGHDAERAVSRLADLVNAVGQERTVEARLTGGFRYGPLRAPVRSGGSAAPMDHWTLYAAAGRIRENALADPSAANLHALGLAHLVLGEFDHAITALEDAIAEDPQPAQYHSDLAAAYLARARHGRRPDDLPRALGAAQRAVDRNDALLEARFNRALALQALFLEAQARAAWEEYLSRDSGSDWAEEARRHLAALQRSAAVRLGLARNNSPPPIDDTTVELGLDWLLRQGLPAWADAVLTHDAVRASLQQTTLTRYAHQIAEASRDPFAMTLVTLPPLDDPQAASQAEVATAFGHALALIASDDLPAAQKALDAACGKAQTAVRLLCEVERSAFDVLRRDDAAAGARSAAVAEQGVATGAIYLQARAARLDGFRAIFRSDYGRALAEYGRAFDLADRAHYRIQAGVMSAQIADIYDVIGLPLEAWRWRLKALEATTLPAPGKSSTWRG